MSNKLVKIPVGSLPALRALYEKDWPNNLVGYHTVDNYIRWYEKLPDIKNLECFSLNGDWSDGTFLIIDRYQLFLNTLNASTDRLSSALNLLDWSKCYKVSSFLKRHRQLILDIVEARNLKLEYDSHTFLYYLPKESAANLKVDPPTSIHLKPMNPDVDAKIADDVWPNKHDGSLFFLKRLIELNPNIGAYNENNELVAWCFRLQAGPLGALQVDKRFQRSGYGSLVTRAMCKILADLGMDTFALVGYNNFPSQKMFEKLGFKYVDDAYWLRTKPEVPIKWID